jgi:ribosomal protein S18 acetylase RimI-like enzyme
MTLKIRRARTGDEYGLHRIKRSLPMPRAAKETAEGGFLLGTTIETYRFFIENAFVDVLENENETVGFAVVLPDELLRISEIWQRKDEIKWESGKATRLLDKPLCYFEQLAVLPDKNYRFYGVALALAAARQAFQKHEAMFATTVVEPVCNRASIPFLESVGGMRVGIIDEFYPEFGNLVSAVHLLEREIFVANLAEHPLKTRIFQQIRNIDETTGEF